MATFTFSGALYQMQEFRFKHEIEADNIDDARAQFQEILGDRHYALHINLEKNDKPRLDNVVYDIFDKPISEIEDETDEMEMVVYAETYNGFS